jgi:hypothetical protein
VIIPVALDGGDRRRVQLLIELRRLTLQATARCAADRHPPTAPLDLPAWRQPTGHIYLGPSPATGRHFTAEEAFAILTTAQETNRKVRDVAQALVDSSAGSTGRHRPRRLRRYPDE